MNTREYHLDFFGPLKNEYVDWPEGSVSVYRIDKDQIAARVVWERVDGKLQITERWPWPDDSLGLYRSIEEAAAAIAADRKANAAK